MPPGSDNGGENDDTSLSLDEGVGSDEVVMEREMESLRNELPGRTDYAAYNDLLTCNPAWANEPEQDRMGDGELGAIMSLARHHDNRPHTWFSRPRTRERRTAC